jgi:hypothetical protein
MSAAGDRDNILIEVPFAGIRSTIAEGEDVAKSGDRSRIGGQDIGEGEETIAHREQTGSSVEGVAEERPVVAAGGLADNEDESVAETVGRHRGGLLEILLTERASMNKMRGELMSVERPGKRAVGHIHITLAELEGETEERSDKARETEDKGERRENTPREEPNGEDREQKDCGERQENRGRAEGRERDSERGEKLGRLAGVGSRDDSKETLADAETIDDVAKDVDDTEKTVDHRQDITEDTEPTPGTTGESSVEKPIETCDEKPRQERRERKGRGSQPDVDIAKEGEDSGHDEKHPRTEDRVRERGEERREGSYYRIRDFLRHNTTLTLREEREVSGT